MGSSRKPSVASTRPALPKTPTPSLPSPRTPSHTGSKPTPAAARESPGRAQVRSAPLHTGNDTTFGLAPRQWDRSTNSLPGPLFVFVQKLADFGQILLGSLASR